MSNVATCMSCSKQSPTEEDEPRILTSCKSDACHGVMRWHLVGSSDVRHEDLDDMKTKPRKKKL